MESMEETTNKPPSANTMYQIDFIPVRYRAYDSELSAASVRRGLPQGDVEQPSGHGAFFKFIDCDDLIAL